MTKTPWRIFLTRGVYHPYLASAAAAAAAAATASVLSEHQAPTNS